MKTNIKFHPVFAIIVAVLLIGSTSYIVFDREHGALHSGIGDGLLIPLYSNPYPGWQEIINLKKEYNNVTFMVIINPDNGSGNSSNQSYQRWVSEFLSAGIIVLGYIYTSYSNRSIAAIEDEITNYSNWYGVHSIFFDEVSDNQLEVPYYKEILNISHLLGVTFTVGNPGTSTPLDYLSIFNVTVVYEDQGYPAISDIEPFAIKVSGARIGVIAYGVPYSSKTISRIANISRVDYFSDWTLPDLYQNISSYLPELAALFS